MADVAVDAKEVAPAPAPEKEVIDKKGEEVAEVEEKKVAEVDDKEVTDAKPKNGICKAKENGSTVEETEEVESTENGTTESSEVPVATKRKSTGGDESVPAEGVTPEKKAKLVEPEEEDASNGAVEAEATA